MIATTHTCTKCRTEKDVSCFQRNRSKPSGLSAWCKDCRKRFDGTTRAGYLKHSMTYRRKHRAKKLLHCIKTKCRMRGLDFDLGDYVQEIQERINAGKCELSGIPFDLDGKMAYNSPSIDRIDPSKGYLYSNIRVVCFAMNCALNSWGEDTLLKVVTAWLNKRAWDEMSPNYAAWQSVQERIARDAFAATGIQ